MFLLVSNGCIEDKISTLIIAEYFICSSSNENKTLRLITENEHDFNT